MSAYTPQQAWSVACSDTVVKHGSLDLDETFTKLRADIKERAKILDKSLRVKVAAWLTKLAQDTHNNVWKKNRNAYAKLLLEQLKCGRLEEPFHVNPDAAPLPTLHKALLYPYLKPKTSSISHKSTVSKPETPQMTPSQLLDSYFSYHGDAGAAPPSPIPIGCLDSLKTPTSRAIHSSTKPNHLNTAASYAHQKKQVAGDSSSWDHAAAAATAAAQDPENGDAASSSAAAVELRLNEAEERLRQHSTLLSLFLDISSADQQLQQLEMKEKEEENISQATTSNASRSSQRHQQQKVKSVAEVLERAERVGKHKKEDNSSLNYTLPANIDTARSSSRLHKEPFLNMNTISEKVLDHRLANFEKETAILKARMSGLPAHCSSFYFHTSTGSKQHHSGSDGDYSGALKERQLSNKETEKLSSSSSPPSPNNRNKSKNVTFIPARHTLKSAAAAEATRKSLENDDDAEFGFDLQYDFRSSSKEDDVEQTAAAKSRKINLQKAAALLKPRPGSTTALISEVAALRKRVASNLACIEESQKDNNNFLSGHGGVVGFDFVSSATWREDL